MDIYSIFIGLIYLLNMILAIVVIFLERKDAASTWAWLLVLFFIPLLGFAIYLLFGQNFSKKKKMFQWEDRKKIGIDEMLKMQISALHNRSLPAENEQVQNHYDLIHMQLVNNDAVLTQDNDIQMYTDGKDKFDALFKDIEGATDHIHLQYYILRRDALSKRLITLLNKKAREGVKVRILYDDLGSRSLTTRFFKSLREARGEVDSTLLIYG